MSYYGIKIEGLKIEEKQDKRLKELISLAMECMGAAATIIDMKGTLLYYNRQAVKILDCKSEYIGKDVHSHHKKANSNKNLDFRKDLSTQLTPVNLVNMDPIQSKRIIEFCLVHAN